MAKKEAREKKVMPHFEPSTVITCRSLVIDGYGNAWWVDPESQTIKPAG